MSCAGASSLLVAEYTRTSKARFRLKVDFATGGERPEVVSGEWTGNVEGFGGGGGEGYVGTLAESSAWIRLAACERVRSIFVLLERSALAQDYMDRDKVLFERAAEPGVEHQRRVEVGSGVEADPECCRARPP